MLVELENKVAALNKQIERLQSELDEKQQECRECGRENDFLYDILNIFYNHGSLDIARLRCMMNDFDVTLDDIADSISGGDVGIEPYDTNQLYYAMFLSALDKAVEEACDELDVSTDDVLLDDSNYEIFTNCLDSSLSIKVNDEWIRVNDFGELIANIRTLIKQIARPDSGDNE